MATHTNILITVQYVTTPDWNPRTMDKSPARSVLEERINVTDESNPRAFAKAKRALEVLGGE